MQQSGMMITSWPAVLGCDASGKVVEVGEGVSKFKVGDLVYGCTRLGMAGYMTFQDYVGSSARAFGKGSSWRKCRY
jgi:NADPH:quinone reductase-like Zn-dependent oxidoreductase